MPDTVRVLRSVTPGASPSTLAHGQLAVNTADNKLWVGDASNNPSLLACGLSNLGAAPWVNLNVVATQARLLGAIASTAATSVPLSANKQNLYPFAVQRETLVTALGGNVTTAAAGSSVLFGIYENTVVDGQDFPAASPYLETSTGADGSTTGWKSNSVATQNTLYPGRVYWASMLPTGGAPSMRAVALDAMAASFGTGSGTGSAMITGVTVNNAGSALLTPMPTVAESYAFKTSAQAAVYLNP